MRTSKKRTFKNNLYFLVVTMVVGSGKKVFLALHDNSSLLPLKGIVSSFLSCREDGIIIPPSDASLDDIVRLYQTTHPILTIMDVNYGFPAVANFTLAQRLCDVFSTDPHGRFFYALTGHEDVRKQAQQHFKGTPLIILDNAYFIMNIEAYLSRVSDPRGYS